MAWWKVTDKTPGQKLREYKVKNQGKIVFEQTEVLHVHL
jgi:hypothetical protein